MRIHLQIYKKIMNYIDEAVQTIKMQVQGNDHHNFNY